jgi:hypothetical protein
MARREPGSGAHLLCLRAWGNWVFGSPGGAADKMTEAVDGLTGELHFSLIFSLTDQFLLL